MERLKVVIIEVLQEQRSYIKDVLSNVEYIKVVGEVKSSEEAFRELEEASVDVILIESTASGDGYKVAEKLNLEYPNIAVIIIEDEFREDIIHKALFAGARDVLIYPFTAAKLVDTIYRSHELLKKKPVNQGEKIREKIKEKIKLGKVITIFSTKGGVGKTFISVNLAVALQKESGKRVVVVDFDLDFGNVALALNIKPKFTLTDVVDDIRNIDPDLMESYLLPHESGIKILPANSKPQLTEFVNGEHVDKILQTLKESFDYIIVDMPARFYEPVNQALVSADYLFMITTPELSTIRNVKSSLITLDELNYPKSKINIILNRADPKGIIKEKDVEATLQQEIFGVISVDYKLAMSSLNQGIPVVNKSKAKGMAKEFIHLAKKIIQESPSSITNKGGGK